MQLIFFNIPFYKKYSGYEDTSLNKYENFYKEKKGTNPEIYNFQDYNGVCYGYVSIKNGIVDLEKISFKNDSSLLYKNTIIVWVSKKDNMYTLIGWYKNAKVYKCLQKKVSYPTLGRDLYYNVETKSKNSFLLPFSKRDFELNIPFSNELNIHIENMDTPLSKKTLNFIESYKNEFENIIYTKKLIETSIDNPPTNPILLNKRGLIYMYNENNFLEAIKYFNTSLIFKDKLSSNEILTIKYQKALCLQFLNCFNFAVKYFDDILPDYKYNFNLYKNMLYLYFLTNNYTNAILMCNIILENEKISSENENIVYEIKCLKADALINENNIKEAIEILEEVLNKSNTKSLKLRCENILKILN